MIMSFYRGLLTASFSRLTNKTNSKPKIKTRVQLRKTKQQNRMLTKTSSLFLSDRGPSGPFLGVLLSSLGGT